MIETQEIRETSPRRLLGEVQEMRDAGFRLVQIGATRTEEGFEVNYSFDKHFTFVNLKIKLPNNDREIPSVSGVYWCAFLYENELHDLFGLQIRHIAIDYKGTFYKVARPAAFAEKPEVAAKVKKAAKPAVATEGEEK
ncbi:MAG: NADH-quinone oxidoreductase subunit C [Deltaproteobacteria bacterium]|nr:NADH-quinone oxidoreductase subunit C [Deltaproteobacteria bacterium]